jgi:malate dehydrogenase (oxaloacetate-decarboxylating)(NADP+)
MRERNYFAAMMVNEGDADGLVTGHTRSYSSVVKPMLQLIDKAGGASIIATTNMMMTRVVLCFCQIQLLILIHLQTI